MTVGRWQFVLDPAHAMLVREAEFVRDGESQPMLRVRTSGLLKPTDPADSQVEFAEVGHYIQFRGGKESSVDVENLRLSLKMDEPFFTAVRAKFDGELPVRSMLVDSRGKEDVYRVVGPEKASPPAAGPPANRWIRDIFFINLGLLGVALFCWFLHTQRRKPGAGGQARQ
jgi:hypothetical protein